MRPRMSVANRSRSQPEETPTETTEIDPARAAIIEERRKKKHESRIRGPRIEGYECPKKVNRSPTIQVNPQHLPLPLVVSPKSRDVVTLTEEGLDDWFAQSLNRKMDNIILSKKEYYMPSSLTAEMKARWSQKPRPFYIETSELLEGQDKRNFSLYFDQKRISPRQLVEEPNRLLFEYSKLQPKNVDGGTPIKRVMGTSHHKNAILAKLSVMNALKGRGNGSDSSTKIGEHNQSPSLTNQSPSVANQSPGTPFTQSLENKFQKAVRKGVGLMRLFSRAKTPGKSDTSEINNRPTSVPKTPQTVTKDMSPIARSTMGEDDKLLIPYHKNAADILRDEELMRENEVFLQQLIEKIHPKKKSSIDNTHDFSELQQYDTDLRTQKRTFERNIQRKLTSLTEKKKEEVSEFVKTLETNERNSVAFSRLKEATEFHSPKKIPDRKIQKLLTKDQMDYDQLESPKKYLTARPVSPSKYARNLMSKQTDRRGAGNKLNKTIDLLSLSPTKNNYSPESKRSSQTNRRSTFKSETGGTGGFSFSKEAKERFVNHYFESQGSCMPSPIKRRDSYESRQSKLDYEMSRIVFNALNKADNEDESIHFTEETIFGTRNNGRHTLNLRLERLRTRGTSMTIDGADSFMSASKEKEKPPVSDHASEAKRSIQEKIDFWFIRGAMQMEKENFHNAIDCFKQILLIYPRYYLCIFNIGCMYERLCNYEAAKKWLRLSYDVNFSKAECLYGLALCDFKSGNAQACFDYLTELEDTTQQSDPHKDYLKALCCKELGKLDQAADYYIRVHKEIKKRIGYDFAKKMFASLLFKTRSTSYKLEEGTALNFIDSADKYLDTKAYYCALDSFQTPEGEWKPDYMDVLARTVSKLRFWSRFPVEYLQTFLGYMNVEKFPVDTVMFPREDTVFIIVTGSISFRDHSMGFLTPRILTCLDEGDILGYEKIDNGVYKKAENWLICQSDVEVLAIKKEDFARIWEAQKTVMRTIYVDMLLETALLKDITLHTLYIIGYELARKEIHKGGQIIYNDNSYMNAHEFNAKLKKRVINEQDLTIKNQEAPVKEEHVREGKRLKGKRSGHTSGILQRHTTNDSEIRVVDSHLEKNVSRGIFVILNGECRVEAKDGYICTTLSRGDFFGESLLLGTKGYNNFGLIRCKTDEVEVLYIPKSEFWRIPKYDVDVMIQNCQNRRGIRHVMATLENRKNKLMLGQI